MGPTSHLESHPLLSRSQGDRSPSRRPAPASTLPSAARARVPRDWRLLISLLLGVAAVVALALGWFMVSGEDNIYAQLPYFFSFGGTALALMLAGVALFVDYEHSCDRRGITLLLERLEQIEIQLGVHDDTSLQGTSTR